jgi:hypothetical protein
MRLVVGGRHDLGPGLCHTAVARRQDSPGAVGRAVQDLL